jgi:hypothetical protein
LKKSVVSYLVGVVFFVAGAFLSSTCTAQAGAGDGALQAGLQQIAGRWVRNDGGYILHLEDVKEDGSLTAAYFNPRPIHVAQAKVRRMEKALTVFVELRDVHYPGSTYTLDYEPETDRLKGLYFQAALNQTFDVEFERVY